MHELFLTAVVPDAELGRAQALLQGLTGMTARAGLHRVLYFAGPPQPRGLAVRRSIPGPLQPPQARLWSELHQQLARQSFVLQVRYPAQAADFGGTAAAAPAAAAAAAAAAGDDSVDSGDSVDSASLQRLNSTPGTLRWTDVPDPTGGSSASGIHRLVTQRKELELPDTWNLPAALQENHYQFKSELVEESFVFYGDGSEYALVRHHRLPGGRSSSGGGAPRAALPAWDEVVRQSARPPPAGGVDPAGQWLFFVRRHVLADTSPEAMSQALDALQAARAQLAGAFAFRPVDRRAHDTRIERPANTMPAPLPQKVRA